MYFLLKMVDFPACHVSLLECIWIGKDSSRMTMNWNYTTRIRWHLNCLISIRHSSFDHAQKWSTYCPLCHSIHLLKSKDADVPGEKLPDLIGYIYIYTHDFDFSNIFVVASFSNTFLIAIPRFIMEPANHPISFCSDSYFWRLWHQALPAYAIGSVCGG